MFQSAGDCLALFVPRPQQRAAKHSRRPAETDGKNGGVVQINFYSLFVDQKTVAPQADERASA
jgi:hypothetical protein